MGAAPLLPGEHEELRLRPAAAGYLPLYLIALLPAVAGAILWGLSRLPSWQCCPDPARPSSPSWQVWNHLWGDEMALAFYAVAGIVVAAIVDYAIRRKARTFVAATAALTLLMIGAAALDGTGLRRHDVIVFLTAGLSIPALAWVEWRRRCTEYVFTNLRLIARRRAPRSEQSVRHEDLVDLKAKRTMGDAGTIIPVLGQAAAAAAPTRQPLRFKGVRPFGRTKSLVELLIQRATAGDYLRADQRLEQRIAEARSSLQRQA